MRKRTQKGFTIVELVIVIAVIAILAAVLIPTFASIIDKANNSADTQMVANINKYLASVEAIDGKNETMSDALLDIVDAGYNATALMNASNTVLWDMETDRVMAIDGKKTVASADGAKYDEDDATGRYWIVAFEYSEETNFSYYLIASNVNPTIPENVKYGLDISSLTFDKVEDMPAITYTGTGANIVFNGEFKSVTVNCGAGSESSENAGINNVVTKLALSENTETGTNGKVRLYGFVAELTLTEGNLEVNGFVGELNGNVLLDNVNGSATGSLTANSARFRQKQTEISEIMEFKTFTDNGSKYEQHYFGTNGDLVYCLCCSDNKAANPNHICVTGTPTTEERGNKTCLVIKCTICEKELVVYELKAECNGTHDLQDAFKKDANCTEPGYVIKWCIRCNNYREINETPALGHAEQAGEGKAATCTEAGLTNGKYCTRCSTESNRVWTEPQVEIPALGHDYDRTTGKCTRCGGDQPTAQIDGDILHSSKTTTKNFGNYDKITFNAYEGVMDKVIFGYKEDYIHSINASKVEFDNGKTYSDVEVYVVYKKNPNCGKSYNEEGYPTDTGEKTGDDRKFLVDYYVLSDKRMCYTNDCGDDTYGFAAGLGVGVMYYYKDEKGYFRLTYHLAGAVKEMRFENFDTSETVSFENMFCLCQVQKMDLSGLVIDNVVNFSNVFSYSNFKEVIYPQSWPANAPKAELTTEGWE